MSDLLIVEVRRVLWRSFGAEQSLLPRLDVEYNDGTVRNVAPGDASLEGYEGAILPYQLTDEILLINAERDRRIAAGVEYPDGSGRAIQTRTQDLENIGQQTLRALVLRGTPEDWGNNRSWLDASNVNPLPLPTPEDMLDLAIHIGNIKERLIYKSYEIKQKRRAGIEVDWTSDAAW
jgi:hypothetical protein